MFPENAETPAATQDQSVRQSTPNKPVLALPGAPIGGLLTCVHDWPLKVRTSVAAPLVPTAAQLVALKQLMPSSVPPPVGVGTFWAMDHDEPFQVRI